MGLYNGQGLQEAPAEDMVLLLKDNTGGCSAHTVQICPHLLSISQYRYGLLVMSNRDGLSFHTRYSHVSRYILSVSCIKELLCVHDACNHKAGEAFPAGMKLNDMQSQCSTSLCRECMKRLKLLPWQPAVRCVLDDGKYSTLLPCCRPVQPHVMHHAEGGRRNGSTARAVQLQSVTILHNVCRVFTQRSHDNSCVASDKPLQKGKTREHLCCI
ncbi:hypothetical protein ABBQ38_002604 [Trebouxia sp. C0009 RCD-2024]